MTGVLLLLAIGASYLLGAIPFGFLIAKVVAGVDIRTAGSGNIGATNVGRTIGWHWFFVVLLFDLLKGFGPALAAAWWLGSEAAWYLEPATVVILCGMAAILGHLYPIYLKFRGGKGMAAGLGVVVALALFVNWLPPVLALATFGIVVAATRYISLGSILGVAVYGVSQLIVVEQPLATEHLVLTAFSIGGPLLVIWRHRANIQRLLQGTESKVGQRAVI